MDDIDKDILYIFIDEAGNFDFSANGSKYFMIGSLAKRRPFAAYNELVKLKYDIIESGLEIEYFHATEDKQNTRDKVYEIIKRNLIGCKIVATIISKNKTNPIMRPPEKIYSELLGHSIRKTLELEKVETIKEVIIFTDSIPAKRQMMKKAIKTTLSRMLPDTVRYRIYHHASKSNLDLQIADYFTWAIQRKWERNDARSYALIKDAIRSETDLLQHELTTYY